jgi:hypothetical protein
VLLAFIGIVLVVALIVIVFNRIKKALPSNTADEREKKRRTRPGDLSLAAEAYELDSEELTLLGEICKQYKVPNITYYFKEIPNIYSLFKRVYKDMNPEDSDDLAKKQILFSLMRHITTVRLATSGIWSTTNIPVGKTVYYIDSKGGKFAMVLLEKDPENMLLTIPTDARGQEARPPELSQIHILIDDLNSAAVSSVCRVLGYRSRQGQEVIALLHTNKLHRYSKEEFTYTDYNKPCTLYEAKKSAPGTEGPPYVTGGPAKQGILINFSGKNCNIASAIREAIGSYLTLVMTDDEGAQATSVIMVTKLYLVNSRNILHATFVHMDLRAADYIYSRANGFVDAQGEAIKEEIESETENSQGVED